MQDGVISSIEFYKLSRKVEKYCKRITDVRNQFKTKIKITKEKGKELLEKGRKEGKAHFLRKIASTSDI